MRRLFLSAIITLTGFFTLATAQDKTDKEASAEYAQEIKIVQSEIKTLKIKLKADKDDSVLKSELAAKEATLKELKSKKKVIDDSIKSKAASEKAEKKAAAAKEKAEKAQQKAEKAAKDAQKVKEG